jgi:hypothetical protein
VRPGSAEGAFFVEQGNSPAGFARPDSSPDKIEIFDRGVFFCTGEMKNAGSKPALRNGHEQWGTPEARS